MPKVELHLHLDGSLRIATAVGLARQSHRGATSYSEMFDLLVPARRLKSQKELLRAFEVPVALLQTPNALALAASELVRDKAADGVVYGEIRWAPLLHTANGLSVPDVIECVAEAVRIAADASGTAFRLIIVGVRSHTPEQNELVAAAAVEARHLGVVAFDIAGDEATFPDLSQHAAACQTAIDGSLHLTVHSGELTDGGVGLMSALKLPVTRIAHGVSAPSNPRVLRILEERKIALDMCPSSNVQAASVRSISEHPAVELHRRGIRVTISTDDTTLSDVLLSDEYFSLWRYCGADLEELWAMNRIAAEVAFCDERTRVTILERLDQWEQSVPF